MSVLPFLIFVPLVAALLALCGGPARKLALSASWLMVVLALLEFAVYRGTPHPYVLFEVLPTIRLNFLIGADGLSLMMVLLTALVTLSAVWMIPKIESGENTFYACVLFIAAGAMGAFVSFDLFFFYAFHELALIPTFLLIGIWGHGDARVATAWKITIYLALGSFVLLVGLIGLYLSVIPEARTFDILELQRMAKEQLAGSTNYFDPSVLKWVCPMLVLGFGILVSLFPFHTWAPPAYAAAPTPAAMLHAGVLKKFGLYGLLRVVLPIMPAQMQEWTNWLLVLLIGNILYVGLVTIAQKRLDTMLGYSSVMHMGYIFLGISSFSVIGLTGASLMMFAHGLSIAALFAVAGEVRARTGTMQMDKLGGLARSMPYLSLIFGMALFASIGLPGFANFASELMVFFGTFDIGSASSKHLSFHQIAVICALWGVVISAVYMLRAYRHVFMGQPSAPAPIAANETPEDLNGSPRWALAILIVGLAVIGFQPSLLVNILKPVVEPLHQAAVASSQANEKSLRVAHDAKTLLGAERPLAKAEY